ncbi:vesicular glutamate transporter 3-like isoform X2 [Planococcus citri]|uniref:vesicular glutamate transporter 3-like isoform X2 n=1 Tax=Planococcus citri TaxID=170843 RepID=UPI0031F7A170
MSVIGVYGGSISSFVVSGWMLQEWKWPMVFYVSAEKMYIKRELDNEARDGEELEYPWMDILTCVPFWIGCLCKFMTGVGFTFTTMYLPQYIKDTTDTDIKRIGYISVIPQICSVIAMPLAGYLFDNIRSNKRLSLTNAHKSYACLGLLMSAGAYLVAGLWSNFTICIVCVSLFSFFITFVVLEIQVLLLDLAPRYAAFMHAIATSGYTLANVLTPITVGLIVTSKSRLLWSSCFFIFSALYILVALLCLKFSSGQLQKWANYSSTERGDEMKKMRKNVQLPNK